MSGSILPRRASSYMQVWFLVFSQVWMFIGVPVGNGYPPDWSRNQQTCRALLYLFLSAGSIHVGLEPSQPVHATVVHRNQCNGRF